MMVFIDLFSGQTVSNIISNIASIGVLLGGAFALFTYWKSTRTNATAWINTLFTHFYTTDTYRLAREAIEYHPEQIYNIVEQRNNNRATPLKNEQLELLVSLDAFLNFFENILYIESQKGFKESDREAMFNYWFSMLSLRVKDSPDLQKYLGNGFEFLSKHIKA